MARHPGGRPRKYKSVQQLQKKIEEYFSQQDTLQKPYTVTGLTLFLGFSDRFSFYDLRDTPEFCHTMKMALNRISEQFEGLLMRGCNNGGAIFWLKNHAWMDQMDVTSKGEKLQSTTVVVNSLDTKASLEEAVQDANKDDNSIR